MIKKALLALLLIFGLSGVNISSALAEENYIYTPQVPKENPNLQGYALYVPAGITLDVVLSCEINSQSAVIGQTINAILTEDFIYNETTIASAGSVINGTIVSNKKAGYGNRNAQTQIKFTTIRTPYNNIIPISASIATDDLSGILKGATAKDSAVEYAKDAAISAASGALIGTTIGALSNGSIGKGAVYGTALGAGMGLIKGASEKGDSVIIPANSQITLYFDQPITMGAQ
jgi:hypothetical protein